jgi:hypothetical protein
MMALELDLGPKIYQIAKYVYEIFCAGRDYCVNYRNLVDALNKAKC